MCSPKASWYYFILGHMGPARNEKIRQALFPSHCYIIPLFYIFFSSFLFFLSLITCWNFPNSSLSVFSIGPFFFQLKYTHSFFMIFVNCVHGAPASKNDTRSVQLFIHLEGKALNADEHRNKWSHTSWSDVCFLTDCFIFAVSINIDPLEDSLLTQVMYCWLVTLHACVRISVCKL